MTMMSTDTGSPMRMDPLSQPMPQLTEPPEQAFAEAFGDADRVRIALWIDRTAPEHDGLFGTDACAVMLELPESTVREALGPLQHLGMVRYSGGLYVRCEHPLWSVLATFRSFALAQRSPAVLNGMPMVPAGRQAGPMVGPQQGTTPARMSGMSRNSRTPADSRTATFYFG